MTRREGAVLRGDGQQADGREGVETGGHFSVGTPVPLFEVGSFGRRLNGYDVSVDGQRFLVIRQLEDASMRPLTVVQNWTELLKK